MWKVVAPGLEYDNLFQTLRQPFPNTKKTYANTTTIRRWRNWRTERNKKTRAKDKKNNFFAKKILQRKLFPTNPHTKNACTETQLKNRKEQIGGTQQKPQWIVSQGYSRTYNSWMQQSRLQWIYQSRDLSYDYPERLWRQYRAVKSRNVFLFT